MFTKLRCGRQWRIWRNQHISAGGVRLEENLRRRLGRSGHRRPHQGLGHQSVDFLLSDPGQAVGHFLGHLRIIELDGDLRCPGQPGGTLFIGNGLQMRRRWRGRPGRPLLRPGLQMAAVVAGIQLQGLPVLSLDLKLKKIGGYGVERDHLLLGQRLNGGHHFGIDAADLLGDSPQLGLVTLLPGIGDQAQGHLVLHR